MDVDDEISNLVDLYMGMFGGGWKWQDLQGLLWLDHHKNTVMSDFENFTVTYMEVSRPFADLANIGSPGVDGPPVMPEDPYAYVVAAFQAPPSTDYVLGPKEPEQAPPSPVYVPYVPEPAYLEFMPPEDEVLPAKEQPLPAALSPTADSPGYIPESYLEEDPEEDDDEDPEEDPTNYHADGGDNGDDEDESSDDDEDDDVDIKEDEEEEEEHLAPADSTIVTLPTVDHAPSAKKTEPFETDESAGTPPPHPAYRVTARILIRDKPPTPFWSDTEVARLLAIPTPLPSPLSPWSSPLPQIPSPPLPPILSPLHLSSPPPASPTYPLGYRAAMIRREPRHRLLPIHHRHISYSPTLEQIHLHQGHHHSYPYRYPLQSTIFIAYATLLTMKRTGPSSAAAAARPTGGFKVYYGFLATMDREIRRDLERDIGYGIIDSWDEMLVDMPGAPATDDTELGRRMTEFATRVRQDTDEIYVRLDDEQTERQLMAGQLNMLYRDRRACSYNSTDGERGYEGLERLGDDLWTLVILHVQRDTKPDDRVWRVSMDPLRGLGAARCTREAGTFIDHEMIDQGVTAALAARDADKNMNGDDSHNLRIVALTWWNTHVKTVGHDAAYGMPWKTLMKMMADKYCPRNEIKKLEMEI
ncbi:hypothetical protein Tco_1375379 [Tanacetum coccineum]